MTTTARSVLKQDILMKLVRRLSPTLRGFNFPLATTSGGSTTTLVDTRLERRNPSANAFDGFAVEIIEKVGSGPEIGEVAVVAAAGYDGTSTLTVAPALTATVETGTNYLLYPPDIEPEAVNDQIDAVQRSTEAPSLYMPSMVPDADFEGDTSDPSTKWPVLDAALTTHVWVTASGLVLIGERAMHVKTSSTDDGVKSGLIAVEGAETVVLSTFVRGADTPLGEVQVDLYDVTNSAIIQSSGKIDDPAWHHVLFTATIPDSCKQVRVQYTNPDTAISEWYIAQDVVLQSASGHLYPAPSWLTRESQIVRSVSMPQGFTAQENYAFTALGEGWADGPEMGLIRRDRAVNVLSVSFTGAGTPAGLIVKRGFDALSSATATSPIDREYMIWRVCANLMIELGDDSWMEYAREAAALAHILGYGGKRRTYSQSPPTVV